MQPDGPSVAPRRFRLKSTITRRRCDFGAPYKFGDRDAHDALKECRPFKDPNFSLSRVLHDTGAQAVAEKEDSEAQTIWYVFALRNTIGNNFILCLNSNLY
jgi:hypothetical protein